MSSFSEIFKLLRVKRGWTQDDVGEKLKISRVNISKYESGSTPEIERLVKIADLFNVTVDYLLGSSGVSKHIFQEAMSTEDERQLKIFLDETEEMLRSKGNISEEKLSQILKFMELTFLEDLLDSRNNKN